MNMNAWLALEGKESSSEIVQDFMGRWLFEKPYYH